VKESIVVLGYYNNEIKTMLENYINNEIKVVSNPKNGVELSETLLNGVKNVKKVYVCVLQEINPLSPVKPCKNSLMQLGNIQTPII